jgi:RHS repeat-associated protein
VEKKLVRKLRVEKGELVETREENGEYLTLEGKDLAQNILWHQDAAGNLTEVVYDALERLVEVILPDGTRHQLRLDGYGRPQNMVRQGIGAIVYDYARDTGLLKHKSFYAATGDLERTESYDYDAIGRIKTALHQLAKDGKTLGFAYDYDGTGAEKVPGQVGYLTGVRGEAFERRNYYNPDGTVFQRIFLIADWREITDDLAYYANGALHLVQRTIRDPKNGEIQETIEKEYLYDAFGRLQKILLNGAPLASLVYDEEGRLAQVDFQPGELMAFHFDGVTHERSGYRQTSASWQSGVNWRYSPRGLIAKEAFTWGPSSWEQLYEYDARGFLQKTQVPTPDATSRGEKTLSEGSYTYGKTGLPESITDHRGSRQITVKDRKLEAGGMSYVYDDCGRVIKKGELLFSYGPDGQLQTAQKQEKRWSFAYDESGERILKRDDQGQVLVAYLGNAYLTARQYIEPVIIAGQLVGLIENHTFRPLPTDPRGTLLGERDQLNLATAFGLRKQVTDLSSALDYVQKGYDKDLGLVRMGLRDYDPYLSQFITPDPLLLERLEKIAQSPTEGNLYSYALNNPLLYKDSSGTAAETAWDAVSLALGVSSFMHNIKEKNYPAALVDAVGIGLDAAATLIPVVPGGAGAGIKAVRQGDKAIDGARLAKGTEDGRAYFSQGNQTPSKVLEAKLLDGNTNPEQCKIGGGLKNTGGEGTRASRREAMRQAGIPTSQQPTGQNSFHAPGTNQPAGRQYNYEVPARGGGTKKMSVQHSLTDNVPGHGPHWEAGPVKAGGQKDSLGRPRLTSNKVKIYE